MPRYYPLRQIEDVEIRTRTIGRLLELRRKLAQEVDAHARPGSLLLATWNLREFGRPKPKHGPRIDESFHYIAEVISHFHLVALQEVNRDLHDFDRLMRLLGPDWRCILTDVTDGTGGNDERMAFVYDRRAVSFRNVAGEIVLPAGRRIAAGDGEEDALQFARTPFLVAFQAGWFKFNLCTVHIYYGDDSGKLERRIGEIRAIARFFKERQKKEAEDYILLGDFNIVSPEHGTMQALAEQGFVVPDALQKDASNLKGDKHYDQIALRPAREMVEIGASGVFHWEEVVFRSEDCDEYVPFMTKAEGKSGKALQTYYETWRTFQMSDHLPMWAQIEVDFTDAYLASLRAGGTPLAG